MYIGTNLTLDIMQVVVDQFQFSMVITLGKFVRSL